MKYHLPFHRQPACSLLATQGLDVSLNEEVKVKRKISNRNSAEDAETGSPGSEQFLEGLLLRAAGLKATVETRIHFGSD